MLREEKRGRKRLEFSLTGNFRSFEKNFFKFGMEIKRINIRRGGGPNSTKSGGKFWGRSKPHRDRWP